ncbi:hypothetical protein OPT61_g6330 [Boeremia exigua]|uniref:Uncharacterized protein n=1 Tax=Boeremia exigua TaxID=749465 RepID=A0ACC2I757_9PLEO|nr:hypothetical protein OPT61_g6330 [Boeremia exigua]
MSISHTETDLPADGPPDLLRRKTFEVSEWNERNLLSLDGGGVRGYWSLLVLEKLMRAIGEEESKQAGRRNESSDILHSFLPAELPENHTQCSTTLPGTEGNDIRYHARRFLPCHYFDLIIGSSTGSLIAIMLARFRMTVADCLEEYETMGQKIFGKPRWLSQRYIGVINRPKYDARAMEDAFKDVTKRRDTISDPRDFDVHAKIKTEEGTCSMFATTMRRVENPGMPSSELPHILRSYPHNKTYKTKTNLNFDVGQGNTEMEVWRVARAATAAPMYFEEVRFTTPDRTVIYSDGGFSRHNNPTRRGIEELEILHIRKGPQGEERGKIGVVVSVGTARSDDLGSGKGIIRLIKRAFNIAGNPDDVAADLEEQNRAHYWRFNDNAGIKVDLDDWKPRNSGKRTLKTIKQRFSEWAADEDNQKMLQKCAVQLVNRRRARTQDVERWQRFSSVTQYECHCNNAWRPFHLGSEFDAHYREKHAPLEETSFWEPRVSASWIYPARVQSRLPNGVMRSLTGRGQQE